MLIIAIPKSASTALMATLGDLRGTKYEQDFSFSNLPIPEECNIIHKYHSDIRQINEKVAKKILRKDTINKQHIFPTNENMEKLKGKKKVVLIRSPYEIVKSYRRSVRSGEGNPVQLASWYEGKNTWIKRAENIGLIEDLKMFRKKWKQADNILLLKYNDLIKNTKEQINRIEKYYDLETTKNDVNLKKKRYTRNKSYLGKIWGLAKPRLVNIGKKTGTYNYLHKARIYIRSKI